MAGESQKTVVTWSIREISLTTVQRIIHPAIVPLKVKASPPASGGCGLAAMLWTLLQSSKYRDVLLSCLVAETQKTLSRSSSVPTYG